MRLWTLHPRYLDSRGLVALWREALLAQAVLGGHTRGYTRHPQLRRFRDAPSPMAAIASYLRAVQAEATARAYRFDASKIVAEKPAAPIAATRGQLDYEWEHLVAKLRLRDAAWLEQFDTLSRPEPHPLFHLVAGPVADWEVMRPHGPPGAAGY
ncbi:MAG: pyrimidine dimer DNA glycosylase/endonuclease V [Burkholderiaceae bacterium]|nr:pyrimidine dimer DNA glycosylase/endonuclease V [Sulfuritalea sp.]MCF8176273.1 pyrimidine dimer DNA glycosylase/endonuclease V [Burkholderiaceae bacterium]